MLNYNEIRDQMNEINLDKEPLILRNKLVQLLSNEPPIYVNECYLKFRMNYDELDDTYQLKTLNKRLVNEDEENLVGIFVVSFDIRQGNLIEWQIPNELNLDNVEFKAIASGLHLMQSDVVYFCKDEMYGLAVFGSLRGEFAEERNCRMKSVGVMAKSFKSLRNYLPFLRAQVKKQLEQISNYEDLIELWNNKSIYLNSDYCDSINIDNNNNPTSEISFVDKIITKIFDSKIAKQLNSINQSDYRIYTRLALHLGPSLFALWRCVLLNKRIIFHSRPPIGNLCYQVYCSSQLGNTSFNFASNKQLIKPFFFVNVSDIDALKAEPFYIACTTEDIFENKPQLYDIFVKDSKLIAVLGENQNSLLKVNSIDKKRYDLLIKKLSQIPIQSRNDDQNDDEEIFLKFFTELNDSIFFSLYEYENGDLKYREEQKRDSNLKRSIKHNDQPVYIDNQQIKKIGIDPSDEKEFLNELIHFYDFNLTLNF